MKSKSRRARLKLQSDIKESEYSNITWRVETLPKLYSLAESYEWPSGIVPVLVKRSDEVFQLELHTGLEYEGSHGEILSETPAKLLASIARNGSIVVAVSGHQSESLSTETKNLVVDFLFGTQKISGYVGERRMFRWIENLDLISSLTTAIKSPTRWSGKQLEIFYRRSEKYQFLHENNAQARRSRFTIEAALSAGIAGGLLGSSIVPLAREFIRAPELASLIGLVAVLLLFLIAVLHLKSIASKK